MFIPFALITMTLVITLLCSYHRHYSSTKTLMTYDWHFIVTIFPFVLDPLIWGPILLIKGTL